MYFIKIDTVMDMMNQSYSKLSKYSVLNKDEIISASETFGVDKLYTTLAACCVDSKQECFEYLYELSEIRYDGLEHSDFELFQYYYKSVMTTLIHAYQQKILRIASYCADFNEENEHCDNCPLSPINAVPIIAKIMESEQISLDAAIIKYQHIIRGDD